MIKVFCDICGVDATSEKENFAVVSLFSKRFSFIDIEKKIEPQIKEEKFQLCSKCSKKLREFLESQKKVENK